MPSSGGLGQFAHDVSPYLILLIFIATFGPFQFGYHLVQSPPLAQELFPPMP
jgi:hypothetical protein